MQESNASTCCVTRDFSTGQANTIRLQRHAHVTSQEEVTMWGSSDGTM